MPNVVLKSWRSGLQKVEADKLLASKANLGLAKGKEAVDQLLDGIPTCIECDSIAAANGDIIANRSLTFHGNALPALQSTLDTVSRFFE